MSDYNTYGKHPETGAIERVRFLDDYYGRRRYGVRFPNGDIFPSTKILTGDPLIEELLAKQKELLARREGLKAVIAEAATCPGGRDILERAIDKIETEGLPDGETKEGKPGDTVSSAG